ncbi:GIY-YIG nuclease family protein [Synechococcus sp. NOUM97013]|uniref:GIY-YIG nuclease family protein n=1 Tax=Synechococcus sp. NOUM97013 TaxID=1442555 RepID=UPI0016480148|nr:GIY-YIG nuclease family protein [Synechococcus sp. NOUM97013]QNI73794.1 GIY-YIG catalytic domain protein [Synechococcus sp. NOUM97013]
MKPSRPFALRLFVPSGQPEGMRIVEKTNWSGIGFVIPRSQLKEFTQRPEASRPGVYLLSGPGPEGGSDRVYVGEADPLGRRLEQHQAKEFWTTAFAFTSKDGYLNKAHAQHLEAQLIQLAEKAKRCRLENIVQGRSISLAEMDLAEANGFLEELLLCCPVLGFRAFEQPVRKTPTSDQKTFHLSGPDASGKGFESPGGFTVLKGAEARSEFVESTPANVIAARSELENQGVFIQSKGHLSLAQDYEFNSPSQAAVMLLARSANGRTNWKDMNGKTLKAYQDEAAAAATEAENL